MDFLTIFLTIILTVIIYYYLNRENKFDKLGIDYVKPYPFVGNMGAVLLRRISITEYIHKIYNSYRHVKYVGFFDFGSPTIIIRDLELAKDITIKYFDNFVNRRGFVDPTIDPLFGNSVFSLQSNKWREIRSLLSPSFTSSKMKSMFILMSECADNFANFFLQKSEKKPCEINSKDVFSRYTNDIIATCAYGLKIDSLRDPDNKFYALGSKSATVDGIFTTKMIFNRSYPRISKFLKLKLFPADSEKFFSNLVKETIARRDENGISRPDMLQLMMETRNSDDRRALTMQEMSAQAFVFFLAGFETSSGFMCFLAHFLAAREDVQVKLRREVDEVFEECQGNLNYEAVNNMVYLAAVVKETLRMFPVVSSFDRVCNAPFELPPAAPGKKPVILKPGDFLWIPPYSINRDPEFYENPDVFDPERFIRNGKLSVDSALPFFSFGQGPRSCIASRFAVLEVKTLFVHLLHKVVIKPSKRMINPLELSPSSFTLSAKGGFFVEFEPSFSW